MDVLAMKLNILFTVLFASSSFTYASQNKAINTGRISFVGQIVNPACELNTSKHGFEINLGDLKESELSQVGKRSKSIPFKFKISTCEQENANAMSISLKSLENHTNQNLLTIINEEKENSAKNIAIEILDHQSKVIRLNGETILPPVDVKNDRILNFSARYVATGKIVTGKVVTAAIIQIEHH